MATTGESKLTVSLTDTPTSTTSGGAKGIGSLPVEMKKTYTARTGHQQMDLSSPGAFVTLAGINATSGPVKAGTRLYLRSSQVLDVRITQINSGGGTSVRTIESVSFLLLEVASAEGITMVEVQGPASGTAEIEWSCIGA